jgi:hypothetical protein
LRASGSSVPATPPRWPGWLTGSGARSRPASPPTSTLATPWHAVLSVPLELVASLWPLRLDMARVAVAQRDSAIAARACRSFETLMGYVDQVVQPEVQRLCQATPGK